MVKKNYPDRKDITELIIVSVKDILALEHEVTEIKTEVNDDTFLFAEPRAVLDSLGLVELLVDVEQRLEEEYGVSITINDDRAVSQKKSPFRTIGSLVDYILSSFEGGD